MRAGMNRRQFMATAAAATAAGAAAAREGKAEVATMDPKLMALARGTKTRVGRAYLALPRSGWPTPLLDLKAEVKEFEATFAKLQPQLADIEFVGNDVVTNAEEFARAKAKMKGVDGILAIHLMLGTGQFITGLLDLGVPVIVFSRPYAGHEWHIIAPLQKQGKK
ncbi:twin-arginine translocation signal domain-containing protein, partial [Candidatus Sumerlaeota bacterium]|nr:twin-arginine translocation signal domain-containing protein [Candidatus Sumerlaeota bacterium]